MDNAEITAQEILSTLMSKQSVDQQQTFRFQLHFNRMTQGQQLDSVKTLDMSGLGLTLMCSEYMQELHRLTSLNLANNDLTDSALMASGIDSLPLVHLDVSHNKVRNPQRCVVHRGPHVHRNARRV